MSAVNDTRRPIFATILLLGVFSVAMGLLEAIVVVYLRQLYYPGGFAFPLKAMPHDALTIEITREVATIVMLVSVGAVAGRTRVERFAYFLFTFGIWDIFYYVWLKVLLDWPPSLLTWDILFLIPVIWAAPVLAPVISACTMIVFAVLILLGVRTGSDVRLTRGEWICLFGGAFISFISFIQTYSLLVLGKGLSAGLFNLSSHEKTHEIIQRYIPTSFNWVLFLMGEILIIFVLLSFARRTLVRRAE